MNILLFLILIIIHSIKSFLKGEVIPPYYEKNFILTESNFMKVYYFYPKITDLNHEIIVQINSSYNGNAYLCTGYFSDKNEENIYFDSNNNQLVNCQKFFNIKNIDIEEFNITNNFNSSSDMNINGLYLIALYLGENNNQKEFSGKIIAFATNSIIPIEQNSYTYLFFKNNYISRNYSFIIRQNNKLFNKKYLNIQILTLKEQNVFNLNLNNDKNELIDQKLNIYSYNNYFNVSNEDNNDYFLNIIFLQNLDKLKNTEFVIFFEYTSINNNLNAISEEKKEINFLVKYDYYFYQKINSNNKEFFYILNDLSNKRGAVSLSFLEIRLESEDINDLINLEKELYSSNFINCKSRYYFNLLTFFKCSKNISSNSNYIILKVSSSGINHLKIRKVQFKELKRIIIDEHDYNNGLYYKSFNSELLIDRIGYFYLPKEKNSSKKQLMYCSQSKTMNFYYSDYDIIEQTNGALYLENARILKISHDNNEENNNFNGFTIITINKEANYFIQLTDITDDLYDNLLIEKMTDEKNLNKEITFDVPIKNYYIFIMNEYNSDTNDIILDVRKIYGKIDIQYIDIDSILEKDFNLKEIILFHNESKYMINVKNPILIHKTTEFIKIINNNYNLDYYYKAKIYLNKYLDKENKKLNSLTPIYLNPFESKIYSLESIYGNINYIFKLGDNYKDYISNNESLVNIIIGNIYLNNIFTLNNKNNFIKGKDTYVYFGDTIKFINNCNQSILIWSNLGIFPNIEDNIKSLYLSQNFYYLYTFSQGHKLSFDWFEIKKKMIYGLIPQKILICLLNENQIKSNGFYYQVLNINQDNNDYLFYNSFINSISYELEEGESHIFLSEDINITVFDFYHKNNSYINYMIFPSSGLSSIIFYIEYLYDISNYTNKLKYLELDNSIYSLNLKLNNDYIKIKNLYDTSNYLVFQCLPCNLVQTKINFKYNNNIYSSDIKDNIDNNIFINSISSGNIFGYINFNFFNKNLIKDDLYINIIKPYKSYIKYYYTRNLNNNYEFQSNYNINVEKDANNHNSFIVSFDCFCKNIKTNYSILIIDKTDIKNQINSECEFLFYLEKKNQFQMNAKYIDFVDNNENIRIKKEISFNKFGNYEIYLMAQTLNDFSIYKFLGRESYSYTSDLHNNHNNEKNEFLSQDIIAIFIFIILLIIVIALFIAFRYVRKKKLINLFNSINNNSLFSNNLKSYKNEEIEFNNISNINDNDNNDKTNINDDSFLLFEKPKIEQEYNEEKNMDNNEKDLAQLGQSPAPLLGNTFCSEEDRIINELAKINESSSINNNEENKYMNTNEGNG